jgi:hypothetical protein
MSRLFLLPLVAAMATFAVHAQSAPPAPTEQKAQTDKAAPADHALSDRNCVTDTGSMIRSTKPRCLPVNGHSYSQEDIRRTGQTELGPALQQLDPSVTVHGR